MQNNISPVNFKNYIQTNYGIIPTGQLAKEKYIQKIFPSLQSSFGGEKDCTLMSITTIISFYQPKIKIQDIYNTVEKIAQKYLYTSNRGTSFIFINNILNKSLQYFNIQHQAQSAYLKNICYNFERIKNSINNNLPVLLNISNDGRNYYKNHTVLIVGYYELNNIKMLAVFDNWTTQMSYVDYNKLSIISSINYLT